MEPIDPADLRISDTDRHRVAEVLREAAGDGRIDLDELEERLEATYAARTYRDLVPLTIDLTGQPPAAPTLPAATARGAGHVPARRTPSGVEPSHTNSWALMSESRREGVWDVGNSYVATAVMGSVVIDLRRARFPAGEVVITANAVMGSVEILLDPGTVARVDGVGVMGSFEERRSDLAADPAPGAPVVRVRGLALMGSVEVRRKAPPALPPAAGG